MVAHGSHCNMRPCIMRLLSHSTDSASHVSSYKGSVALRPHRNVADDRGQISLRLAEGEIWTLSCDLEGLISGRGRGDNSPPTLLANKQ